MARLIRFTPRKITILLACVIGLLLVANLTVIYLHFVSGYEYLKGLLHAFYFDTEANFPSLYSTMAIFGASCLLWIIGDLAEERARKLSAYWKFLSGLFFFLAIDEFASVHEMLIEPVKAMTERASIQSDLLYFPWFLPYGIVLAIIAIAYIRFMRKLPRRTALLIVLAAAVFVSGAIVMEMIGGRYWAQQGWSIKGTDPVDINYALIATTEELLEMIGILIFIFTLLDYYMMKSSEHTVTLSLTREEKP